MSLAGPEINITKGGALVVPGFNTLPASMGALERKIEGMGFHARRIVLSGLDSPRLSKADRSEWSSQIILESERLRKDLRGGDLIAVGFSLGGAMVLKAAVESGIFDKIILFAPALALTPLSEMIRIFLPLRFLPIALPSFAPAPYRQDRLVSLRAYKQIVAAVDEMSLLPAGPLAQIPILNLIRADDELVSFSGVELWLRARAGQSLRSVTLPPDPSAAFSRPHIIIDPPSAGRENWRTIENEIESFLA